jgi:CRP-like cAMP-binding protein
LDEDNSQTEVFKSVPLFRGLEDPELKAIMNLSKEMSFRTGDTIVKEGDAGLGFYVIVDGQAEVRHKGRKVADLRRGSFFGEMSLFDDQPRSADVIAVEPTRCQVLLRWNFWSLISKNKKVVRGLFAEMARRLRSTDRALVE